MPRYFVVDARFSLAKRCDGRCPVTGKRRGCQCDICLPRVKATRTRSGSGSSTVSSCCTGLSSPVKPLAQTLPVSSVRSQQFDMHSTGGEPWDRHTTATMAAPSERHGDSFFEDAWSRPNLAKSNHRNVWQRFAESVDKCVYRVVAKFYR